MKKLLISVLFMLTLLCIYTPASLATVDKSLNEAINWVLGHNEGIGYEYDGSTDRYINGELWIMTNQCVDLIRGYMDFVTPGQHTSGNGGQYIDNELPAGYTRIQKSSGFTPARGDILIWTGDPGHVAIVTDVLSSTDIVYTDQNGGSVDGVSYYKKVKHNRHMNPQDNNYWGVIRPDFDLTAPVFTDEEATITDISIHGFKVTARATDNVGITSAAIEVWPSEDKTRAKRIEGVFDENTQTVSFTIDIEQDVQYLDDSYGFTCTIDDKAGNGPTYLTSNQSVGIYGLRCLAGDEYRAKEDVDIFIAPQYSFNGYNTKAFTQKAYSIWDQDTWVTYSVIGEMTVDGTHWYRLGRRMWAHAESFEKVKTLGESLSDLWGSITRGSLFYVSSGDDGKSGGSGWCVSSLDDPITIPGKQYTVYGSISSPQALELADTYVSFVAQENTDFSIQLVNTGDHSAVRITDYIGGPGPLEIPAEIGGYPVTQIGNQAFFNCTGLTSITIPETVTSIGYSAFNGCSNVTSLVMPHNSTLYETVDSTKNAHIGHSAFNNMPALREITLPVEWDQGSNYYDSFCISGSESVEVIHYIKSSTGEMVDRSGNDTCIENASYKSLKSVDFEEGILSVGDCVFYHYYGEDDGCSLAEVKLPSTLVSIGSGAFMHLEHLERIDLPTGLREIGGSAFACSGLTTIVLPSGLKKIPANCFWSCDRLSEVSISDTVEDIGEMAFCNCSSLSDFPLRSSGSVSTIRGQAFFNCTALTSITIPETVTSIGYSAFEGCSNAVSLVMPHNSTLYETVDSTKNAHIGHSAFNNMPALKEITLPVEWDQGSSYYDSFCISGSQSVEVIHYIKSSTGEMVDRSGNDTCIENASYKSLKSVDFEEGILSIGDNVFNHYYGEDDGCSLAEVNLPSTLVSIGSGAFMHLEHLEHIDLPSGLKEIGDSAFAYTGLIELTLPDSLEEITPYCFSDALALARLYISRNSLLSQVDETAFSNCSSLIIYGYDNSYIQSYAQAHSIRFIAVDGEKLRPDIVLPANVKIIEEEAFEGCTFRAVEIPEGCTEISKRAFAECYNLEQITIPTSVKQIALDAFEENGQVIIYCKTGSVAEDFAQKLGLLYVSE